MLKFTLCGHTNSSKRVTDRHTDRRMLSDSAVISLFNIELAIRGMGEGVGVRNTVH